MTTFITLFCLVLICGAVTYILFNDIEILNKIYNYFGNDYKNHGWICDFVIISLLVGIILAIGLLVNLGLIVLIL